MWNLLNIVKRQATVSAGSSVLVTVAPTPTPTPTPTPSSTPVVVVTPTPTPTPTVVASSAVGGSVASSSKAASPAASSSSILVGGVISAPAGSASGKTTATGTGAKTTNAIAPLASSAANGTNVVTSAAVAAPAPPRSSSLALSTGASSVPVAPLQVVLAGPSATAQVANPVQAVPKTTYTGQALLTASCAAPQYTFLPQADGSYIVAPIVGCNGENPGCCPSFSLNSAAPAITASMIPLSQANAAMVSAIEAAPLTYCPADYTSTAGNCCPIGFGLYAQRVLDQTPCFSALSTTLEVPALVSAQISSLSSILAAAQSQMPKISVANGEVFALSFPLKNGVERAGNKSSGFGLGAKIGIGIAAGVIVIGLVILVLFCLRRRKHKHQHVRNVSNNSDITAFTAGAHHSSANDERKSMASTATTTVSPAWSPNLKPGHTSYADSEHIPGPAGENWDPSKQQYIRPPPPRAPLQNMMGQTGPRYSELAGSDYVAPVEVDGSQTAYSPPPQQQHQLYQQGGIGHPYELDSQHTTYQAPNPNVVRHELSDGTDPTVRPRWME